MSNDINPEHGPIEDESSLIEQSVGEVIGMLESVIAEIKDPTSTFTYDITCDPSNHLKDLQTIMTHLEDAYEAMTPSHLKAEAEELARVVELHELRAELRAEADAEHQADAQAELEADVRCYDDLEGGWY
tara:strand:- start:129 stop:518 length:390 start_codon:yes stop_codon:yes gene_type:complete